MICRMNSGRKIKDKLSHLINRWLFLKKQGTDDYLLTIIFENTQEAIVDEETQITVQKIRETKHRPKFSCFTSNKFLNVCFNSIF